MKKEKRNVQDARRKHLEAKRILQQELEKKKGKIMTTSPQDRIKQIYQKARQDLQQKQNPNKIDEEPTLIHQIILPDDPTEEFQTISLQQEIQKLTLLTQDQQKQKEILNLALKVKELQDKYDLLHNNILHLYHLTKK